MPKQGMELGANLYELWRAGRDNLPSVAREYAVASGHVADTDNGLNAAFLRAEQFGGAYGPVLAGWSALRDEFQTMLADTAANLDLTGDALCMAANQYAKADHAAADEFDRLKRDNGDPVPVDIPPPRYPS